MKSQNTTLGQKYTFYPKIRSFKITFFFTEIHNFLHNAHLFKYQIQVNLWTKSVILPQCEYCYKQGDKNKLCSLQFLMDDAFYYRGKVFLCNPVFIYFQCLAYNSELGIQSVSQKNTEELMMDYFIGLWIIIDSHFFLFSSLSLPCIANSHHSMLHHAAYNFSNPVPPLEITGSNTIYIPG